MISKHNEDVYYATQNGSHVRVVGTQGSVETKLHGIKKLSEEVRWYTAVASMTVGLSESVQALLADDDRVCHNIDALEFACHEESDNVLQISPFVWKRLAYTCRSGLYADLLRDDCIRATQVAFCFMTQRIFAEARAPPWCLTQGNISDNLDELLRGDVLVHDDVSCKMLELLREGLQL